MLQLAKLNIDDDGSILVKINGRDCGLRFNQWAYVLASKSAYEIGDFRLIDKARGKRSRDSFHRGLRLLQISERC